MLLSSSIMESRERMEAASSGGGGVCLMGEGFLILFDD